MAHEAISCFEQPFVIVRKIETEPLYVNGLYVKPKDERIPAVGSVQPLNGRDLLLLPEGQRERESRKIYTTTELKTDDKIEFNDKLWEVSNVDELFGLDGILDHYKAEIFFANELERTGQSYRDLVLEDDPEAFWPLDEDVPCP